MTSIRNDCRSLAGRVLLLFAGFFALGGCEQAASPSSQNGAVAMQANARWQPFVDEFMEAYFLANPTFAVDQGRHEFDGRLPDWSAEGFRREIARLERWRERAVAFEDRVLLPEQRFQRDYLISRIDDDLFWLREARLPFTNPSYYFDYGLDPSVYVVLPYAPAEQRIRAFIAYARAIPQALQHVRANLPGPLPRTFAEFAVAGFAGFAEFYRTDVVQAFAEVGDAQLQAELRGAIDVAAQAMLETSKYFAQQQARATENFALGEEQFAAMLRMTEGVETPLRMLEEVGRKDLERNSQLLARSCERYAPKQTLARCLARIAADKPKGGAVSGARQQLAQLKQFLLEKDLVTIPVEQEALVAEAPPYRRQNFAYIHIPGPFDQHLPSVYYIAPPDPSWTKQEQNDYVPGRADLLFTSIHEVWPGHFLQFLHTHRVRWPFARSFVGYAYAEGWAHYTEELMVEAGIAEHAPELQVGQVVNALLRNVRFICAIGLHTRGMTVAECERMFRERAHQDPGNARQQAARGTYDPAYLNYTLGKLMIRKLREDWTAARGGRSAWKSFHDRFLSYGGPPIPLVREQMMKSNRGSLF